jgi:hypothetical protein
LVEEDLIVVKPLEEGSIGFFSVQSMIGSTGKLSSR